ncbi:MAG: DUF1376 domain-containing protein [Candidatus Hydrogenedentes bacterium]|nr:DUF1376 domain-containing protein [Candidatus Hydrogenedentota bacterium]
MSDSSRRCGFVFYPDKWIAATFSLSAEAYRAYHMILCYMWRDGNDQCSIPIDNSVLTRATGLSGRKLNAAMREIQNPANPLLREEDGCYVSNGLRKEVQAQARRSQMARESANSRWKSGGETDANAMRTQYERSAKAYANGMRTACAPACDPQCETDAKGMLLKTKDLKTKEKKDLSQPKRRSEGGSGETNAPGGSALGGGTSSRENAKPTAIADILPPQPESLIERFVAHEQPDARRSRRSFWERRLKEMAKVPGGEDRCWELLQELDNRDDPRLRETKGFNGAVKNPSAWLNKQTAAWLTEQAEVAQ